MAHIRKPYFILDLEHREGTSSKNIPPHLVESLQLITELKPDRGKIAYFTSKDSNFIVWSKNETRLEKLHNIDWTNPNIPVQNQGKHKSCWSTSGSENISEARYIHRVDMEYTPLSGQYLMDFVDPKQAKDRCRQSNGDHYCYGYSTFKGLQYAMRHGMPTQDDWKGIGCGGGNLPDCNLGEVRLKHVLNDVKFFSGVNKALDYLNIQPILGALAIFYPEFKSVKDGIYRGPTSKKSKFNSWHAVSIRSIKVVRGETIAFVKNSHGLKSGVNGYIKVSMDVMLLEVENKGKPSFPSPGRLFRSFTYGEVRPKYEKEVVEWYVDGEKKYDQFTGSENTTSLILEGIFNNTSGNVFEYEDAESEVIGSPTDRAIFKWAIQLQSNMNFPYRKLDSSTITCSPCNSKPKCQGILVNIQNTGKSGVRIHWKGNAVFLLGKCTKYDSNGLLLEMNETKETELKDAINDMVARKLICIALAFKEIRKEDIPCEEKERQQWVFPCEDLVLLTIFGINNPCLKGEDDAEIQAPVDFEDGVEQDGKMADLANLADLVDSAICPSISEGLKKLDVWTIGAVDNSEVKLNYDQVFMRDFVFVRNFILKTKSLRLQSWEKKIDRFQLGEGVMPASLKVSNDPVRNHETLIADFDESSIGRLASVDSGSWWIILLRAYTKSIECQKSIQLMLRLCLSEGFDIFPTLLCTDGCCLIDRRTGDYGYPTEIQALFFMALRCAVLLLKEDGEGTEMVEQIIKQLHALSYFWLDMKQRNDIYRCKTEEYSHSIVNKFNVIPDSLPEWIFNYMSPHRGLFVGNFCPTRMDFSWFAFGNCIAILSSLATPEHFTAIIDLIESRWEELVGEMPLKVCYPTIGSHEWRIVTGCDPKNTRWSYHNGGSWPVLIWLLMATCIKTGGPQIARRAIEVAEARLHKDHWPEYYDGKLGRNEQARKCQTWSIAGYSVQSPGEATGYVEEEKLVAHGNCGLSSSAKSGKS